jgi:ubiquinol-cytochrome c reductase cytochrome b subunit
MLRRLTAEFESRTGLVSLVRKALDGQVRGGARFIYSFGAILTVLFVTEAITGAGLALYYSPSATQAWPSVYYIQYRVALGWLLRGLHQYGAQAMLIVVGLHLLQTFTFGAYKKPREVVWWSGLVLLFVVLFFVLSGYVLPWDQRAYWDTQVRTGIAGSAPLLGHEIQYLIQGGNALGNQTLTRSYGLHVAILPVLATALVLGHVALSRKAGGPTPTWRLDDQTAEPATRRWFLMIATAALLFAAGFATVSFLPVAAALVIGLSAGLAPIAVHALRGAGVLSSKDDPKTIDAFWPDQVARDAIFSLAVVLAIIIVTLIRPAPLAAPADPTVNYLPRPDWYFLFLYQFLKYFEGPMRVVGSMVVPGLVTLALFALPLVDRYATRSPFSPRRTPYVCFMYGLVAGIFLLIYLSVRSDARDPEVRRLRKEAQRASLRAVELARSGIPPEGAAALLASDPREHGRRLFGARCDSCHAIEGSGGKKGPDLTGYLSRAWLVALLQNPDDPRFYGNAKISGMESYSKLGEEKLGLLADFLIALSSHDMAPEQYPPEMHDGYKLYLDASCDGCHSLKPGESNAATNLSGYGGARWLHEFLADPGTPLFYDKDNHMPAFGPRLAPKEIDAATTFLMDLATPVVVASP